MHSTARRTRCSGRTRTTWLLNVYIFGKPASLSQAYFIELKPVGQGANKRWLVSDNVPNGGAQNVPALSPDGG